MTPQDTTRSVREEEIDRSEAYLDIVWRQFKKNTGAYVALWLLAPTFLTAIFAPVIASCQPFVFHDGDQTIYPWLRALFNPAEPVDFLFNMALLGFVPWVLLSIGVNVLCKRRKIAGRRRVLVVAGLYGIVTTALCIVFLIPQLRPTDKYRSRVFVAEEFVSDGAKQGVYAPIPFGALEIDTSSRFEPPGYRKPVDRRQDANDGVVHLLGTDNTGRDVLVRMIFGTRLALSVGFIAVGIYLAIGIVVGAVAGYFGGWVDMVACRLIEIMLLFPSFFLIMTLVALIGPSIYIIMFVIGITRWATIARLIRGEVLKQRAIDYTQAARSLGASHARIIFRHIMPNAISPALVAAPFGIAGAIIVEAGLSLLGFGVQQPTPSWGTILRLAHGNYNYWWLIVVPSLAIFFTVTVFNLVGSGLRDAMDPRLRN